MKLKTFSVLSGISVLLTFGLIWNQSRFTLALAAPVTSFTTLVNVRQFGVFGNGTDETTKVKRAYDGIDKTYGSTLYFPPGDYKFNLVVTNKNITLWFDSWTKDDSGSPVVNRVRAADTAQPILTIGDGVNFAKGTRVVGGYFLGESTGVGLRLAGGAYECTFQDTQFYGFATNIWVQASGLTLPCAINRFYNGSCLAANIDNSRGVYVAAPDAGTGFTTGTYFFGYHFNSQVGGVNTHIAEFDGSAVDVVNSYFDFLTGSPILFSQTAGINVQPPILRCSNVAIDGGSTYPVVQENFSASKRISAIVQGWYTFNGQAKWTDGTISEQALCQSGLENGGSLFAPIIRGVQTFLPSAGDLTNRTWMQIYNDEANTLVVTHTNGPVRINSSTNVYFSILDTNKVNIATNGFNVTGRFHLIDFGAGNYSDGPQTNAMRVSVLVDDAKVVDAIHIDAYSHLFTDGEGAAISFGLRDDLNGDLTSRIVHYGNVDIDTATRLGLQSHSAAAGTWNTGLWINEIGAVSVGSTNAAASAALEVVSTTGGVLFPRMTTGQRDAIPTLVDGLVVYNTSTSKLQIRAASTWVDLH